MNKRELLFGKLKKVPSRLNDLHCVTWCHEFVCAFVAFCCHTVYILFGIKLLFIIGMNLLNDNLFYYVVQHYSNVFTCSGIIIRKTKNSSFKNEKSKKEVDVTITVSNKDIV